MKPDSEQKSNGGQSPSAFEAIVAFYKYLEIVVATLIFGLIVGVGVYFSKRDQTGLVLGGAITMTGLIAGIILAARAWKKDRTIH